MHKLAQHFIDKVSIIKLSNDKDYSDNQYQAFVIIHDNMNNTEKNLGIYPEQATLNANTGLQR